MNPTSLSLLDRLRHAGAADPDWQVLDDLYRPLIRAWLNRVPGLGNDIDDLTQEVMVVLLRELPHFERRCDGAFRAWLRQITVNQIRRCLDSRRRKPAAGAGGDDAAGFLDQLADPNGNLSRQWDQDHERHVFGKLLAIVRRDFQPATWEAFARFALEARTAAEVADELGTTEEAVLKAKFRVLKRLREEAAEILFD